MRTPELVEQHFRGHYRRGAIIRFEMPCDDPNRIVRDKFGVVLNLDLSDPEALLAITTTNEKYFASGFIENDIVRITAGIYPCFPEPTIVSLREIKIYPLRWIKDLCLQSKMTFEGNISDGDIMEIDAKLRGSVLIEGTIQLRIVRL